MGGATFGGTEGDIILFRSGVGGARSEGAGECEGAIECARREGIVEGFGVCGGERGIKVRGRAEII